MALVESQNDWLSAGTPEQRDKEYKKAREALVQEQKEIQQKVQAFQKRARDLTPAPAQP